MKKILLIIILAIALMKPVPAYAATVTPIPAVVETTYTVELTADEKAILLDSIQTIRAILVFFVFVLVIFVILKFFSLFF